MIQRIGQVTVRQDDPTSPAIPVPGATIYVYNEDGTSATLTSDGTTTLAQPLICDQFGNYSYYANAGVYREDTWYGGKLRFREVVAVGLGVSQSITVTAAAGQDVSSRTLLASIASPANLQKATLTEPGREGAFVFSSANNATNVTADPNQIAFVAPASDTTGASGAWVRKDKVLRLGMAGAVGDGATNDLAAIQAMSDWFFNDGTKFYDYSLDVTGNFAVSGSLNFGPSAPSTVNRRWNVSGQFTLTQLQSGVTRTIKVRTLNYGVYPIRFEIVGYGAFKTAFSSIDTFIGIEFENCAYAQFQSVFTHGHYYAGVNIIGNSPLFAEHLRIANVIGQYCGSGYTATNASLTSAWTSGAQSGSAGNTAQSQVINVTTLPKTLLDTAGPGAGFPKAVRLRIGSDPEPYLVTAIDRATNNVTINAWLRPAAGASGTLTWCFGGVFVIDGSDTEGVKVDKLYGILCGTAYVGAAGYGATMGEIDAENCGTGVVFGGNPNSVSYGHQIGNLYCEGNSEDVIYIGHWGGFQYSQILSSYTITTSKIHQIGDPTNADGSFGFAGGALGVYGAANGKASIEISGTPHRFYWPPPGSTPMPTTTATFLDHGEKPTVRPQFRDSQTVTLGTIDTNLTRLFGYPGAIWLYIGTGGNSAPTGTFTFTPPTGGTINGGAANASVSFSGFSGPVSFGIYTDTTNLIWQVRVLSGGMPAPIVQKLTSAATVTPDASQHQVHITAQAAALAIANHTGTPNTGQELVIRVKDNGTARAISFGTAYRACGAALPTTTTLSKITYMRFLYNATDSVWDCIFAVTQT